jgi:biotin transport system ATP-binding protein
MLNGLVTATGGSVRVHGLDPVKQAKQLRRTVGFIFSNPDAQIVMPTVAEDVAFSLRGRGLSRPEVDGRVSTTLDTYGLAAHADAPAHTLSGGQKQLLALSAILIGEPDLVVADEPTALLDASNTRRIGNHLLDELSQQLVLVTHDLRLAARCDVVLRFEDGRLLEHGDPLDVIARYERDHA